MLNRIQDKIKGPAGPHVEPGTQKVPYSADDKFLHLELTKKINLERRKLAQGRAKNSEVSKAIIKECAKKIGEMEAKYAMKHAEKFQEWQYVQWMLGKPVLEDQNWKQRVGGDLNRIDNLKQTPGFRERAYTIIDNYYDFRKFMAHLVFNGPLDDKQAYAYWKYIVNTGLRDSLVKADGEFNTDNYDNFLEYILLNFGLSSDELAEAFGYVPKDPTQDAGEWNLDETLRLGKNNNRRVTLFDRMASRQIDPRYESGAAKVATQEAYEDYYKEHAAGISARVKEENIVDKQTDITKSFVDNVLKNTDFKQYFPEDKYADLHHNMGVLNDSLGKIDQSIKDLTDLMASIGSGNQPAPSAGAPTTSTASNRQSVGFGNRLASIGSYLLPSSVSSSSQPQQPDPAVTQLETQVKKLEKDLQDMQTNHANTVNQLNTDLATVQLKNKQLQTKIITLESQMQQGQTNYQNLEQQHQQALSQLSTLQNQNTTLQDTLLQVQQAIINKEAESKKAIAQAHAEISKLTGDVQSLTQSHLSLHSQLTTKNDEINAVQQTLNEKLDEIKDLQNNSLQDADSIGQLQVQVNSLTQTIKKLQDQINNLNQPTSGRLATPPSIVPSKPASPRSAKSSRASSPTPPASTTPSSSHVVQTATPQKPVTSVEASTPPSTSTQQALTLDDKSPGFTPAKKTKLISDSEKAIGFRTGATFRESIIAQPLVFRESIENDVLDQNLEDFWPRNLLPYRPDLTSMQGKQKFDAAFQDPSTFTLTDKFINNENAPEFKYMDPSMTELFQYTKKSFNDFMNSGDKRVDDAAGFIYDEYELALNASKYKSPEEFNKRADVTLRTDIFNERHVANRTLKIIGALTVLRLKNNDSETHTMDTRDYSNYNGMIRVLQSRNFAVMDHLRKKAKNLPAGDKDKQPILNHYRRIKYASKLLDDQYYGVVQRAQIVYNKK